MALKEKCKQRKICLQEAHTVNHHRISELGQQIASNTRIEHLVLPEREKQQLKEIILHFAQHRKIYTEDAFKGASNRGFGTTVLFSGPNSTGKIMAAEAIANELQMDLFHIDLSAIISKYIGETEKNLHEIFEAAEESESILFFDEADALFNKRSEVKDSHDRYTNIEANYLLQQMENYNGLTILATNTQEIIDQTIVRRLKFVVEFPCSNKKSGKKSKDKIFPKRHPSKD